MLDALVNIGYLSDHNVIFYVICPDVINYIMLADDVLGITTPRLG
jgi:hypothetical protein